MRSIPAVIFKLYPAAYTQEREIGRELGNTFSAYSRWIEWGGVGHSQMAAKITNVFVMSSGKKYWQDKSCGNLSTANWMNKEKQEEQEQEKNGAKSMFQHNRIARANFSLSRVLSNSEKKMHGIGKDTR